MNFVEDHDSLRRLLVLLLRLLKFSCMMHTYRNMSMAVCEEEDERLFL